MGLLDGRVVIVTGAGRGLGREHALAVAREGAIVVLNDLGVSLRGDSEGSTRSPTEDVVDEIEAMGGIAVTNGASVSDWQPWKTSSVTRSRNSVIFTPWSTTPDSCETE
jgi:NAD(P)-dependent dehydrogenase (short-subunit alcohol dehydrogenase family)